MKALAEISLASPETMTIDPKDNLKVFSPKILLPGKIYLDTLSL
jgi:hypothetical protein